MADERAGAQGATTITVPELALVLLIGASATGKSTFARRHFRPTEVVSSDQCRALVADDENDQTATTDAFDLLHAIAARRLARGRLTVVDATNVQPHARRPLIALAREYHALPCAIVFDLPEKVAQERNRSRTDRQIPGGAIHRQVEDLRRSFRGLEREGLRAVHVLRSPDEVDAVRAVVREPLYANRYRSDRGPFDIVGDVHGCYDELHALLQERLGYRIEEAADAPYGVLVTPPPGRKAVFLGDLVDRGPKVVPVLRLVMSMVRTGAALCVPGNHERKLHGALSGTRRVQMTHGLPESLAQLSGESAAFRDEVAAFLNGLTSHYVLDEGRLVVAHAGLPEPMHGRGSGRVREFALYGETTGETDELGLPVRYLWAQDYRGKATVVYGYTPVPYPPRWLNNTLCIDTGCVFGGYLTALRYPERELVAVPAAQVYYQPLRPLGAGVIPTTASAPPPALPAAEMARPAQQSADEVLDLSDVLGRRAIETRIGGIVTIREEEAAAALEAMSRFAADPRWLVYLPPTMAPAETSARPELLEHPDEAFAYFRSEGVQRVVCEEKHMGSRAVVVVCADEAAARQRFGVEASSAAGIVYTRTGRQFFDVPELEAAFLGRVRAAIGAAGLWDELRTDWLVLDAELLPWSAKAQELLRQQYAAVGAAALAVLPVAAQTAEAAATRGLETQELAARTRAREEMVLRYVAAYGRYCWPVRDLGDLRLAPFHLLAFEGAVHADKDHLWHLGLLGRLSVQDPTLLLATAHQVVDLADGASCAAGVSWWEALTGRGGEGMVVKPLDYLARGRKGRIVQPALKCRGREYLRLIYGPEYTASENLARLRGRNVGAKRSLAFRELALGLEALERFVAGEPLRRVHECSFGVLALESDPVDPRL